MSQNLFDEKPKQTNSSGNLVSSDNKPLHELIVFVFYDDMSQYVNSNLTMWFNWTLFYVPTKTVKDISLSNVGVSIRSCHLCFSPKVYTIFG